jgi:hypothetical protein
MTPIQAEIDRMTDLGASVGQIEHHLIALGVREDEEPSADVLWWWKHREAYPSCCGPNYPDGYAPKQASQGVDP